MESPPPAPADRQPLFGFVSENSKMTRPRLMRALFLAVAGLGLLTDEVGAAHIFRRCRSRSRVCCRSTTACTGPALNYSAVAPPVPDAAKKGSPGLANPADEKPRPYSVSFVGEDGKPIRDASFFLYETKGGEYSRALFRFHKLSRDATIVLNELPAEYMMGIASDKYFYHRFWEPGEIELARGSNVIPVEQTGAVSLLFSHVDDAIRTQRGSSPVILSFRKSDDGEYKPCSGIGGWPAVGRPIDIAGLRAGIYRFQLKSTYEAKNSYWEIENVPVSKGAIRLLGDLKAVADD
jgi:hypothetical protein